MILALDLSGQTGYAVGNPCGVPVYGHWKLDAGRPSLRFLQLARRVSSTIREHEVTDVCIEEAFVGRGMSKKGLLTLFGYRAAAMIASESAGIQPRMYTPLEVRKAVMGTGGLKRKDAKAAVIDKMEWFGHQPENDDEADALALWHYRCELVSTRHFAMRMRKGSWA